MIMSRQIISVIILGEGITEKYYFDSLRDILKIKPKVNNPKHTSIQSLGQEIKKRIREGYNKIYCLMDMDNKINDGHSEHRKNSEAYLKLKRKYHKKKIRSKDGEAEVIMVESYPSTELFFLYYFGYRGAEYTNEQLKRILNEKTGYRVEEKYFIKNSLHDLFEDHGGSLKTAILAAEKSVMTKDEKNPHASYSEIGSLIRMLLPKEWWSE